MASVDRYAADAAVIGGGMAGLVAARELALAGLRVTLIEARERLGGRVFTEHVAGWPVPVELGAEFVHGTPEATLELVRAAGAELKPTVERHLVKSGSEFAPMNDFWQRMQALLAGVDLDAPDQTGAALLREAGCDEETGRLFTMFVEGFHAAHIERVSAHWLKRQMSGDEAQFRIAGGYGRLVAFLEQELERLQVRIARSTPVRGVRWEPESAWLDLGGASEARGGVGDALRARAAVVALPLSLLSEQAVVFAPALDPTPFSALATGHALRVVLRLREPIWERAGLRELSFVHSPALDFPTFWSAAPEPAPQLTAWCGGSRAERLEALPREAIVERALGSLGELLGIEPRSVAASVIQAHLHGFGADPWARGAYSYERVNAGAAAALRRPMARTLFLAGEYCEVEDSGTVGAALGSGRTAARRILETLG